MQPSPKPTLDQIFHAALERQAGAERQAYLDGVCAGDPDRQRTVEDLIASHEEASGFLEKPLMEPSLPLGAAVGDRIGPYKLLQEIGEGGMGVVYMAEQSSPIRRKVALKIIKLGMDTKQVIARFEAERQALALMEHPNIARVLDAGATETGRPYFVMELVRGEPIHEYCDRHQLSTHRRMGLFIDTCHAVQHAHQKGIIHRDIKPGNVLVTSHDGTPVVKIIDFGVAKATNQRLTEKTLFTEFRQFIGTPEYMSPEQAEMSGLDVDTRTDIYALGVLFYQLLAGSTPFDARTLRQAEYAEMTRMIREDEPPTPSTRLSKLSEGLEKLARRRGSEAGALVKLLRGDLDWIVMKAIAKDRTRRYDSASALADDVARHLNHEPVLASPPSSIYRIQKLLQRNRALLWAGSIAALGLLIGGGVALSSYLAAKAEAERSSRISSTLTELLSVAGTGDVLDMRVDDILRTAREVFGSDHTTVAATLSAMAGQLRGAGDPKGAQALYEEALAIYRAAYGDQHRSVGQTLAQVGILQSINGELLDAEATLREALAIVNEQAGGSAHHATGTHRELARLLSARGEHVEAERQLGEALEVLDQSPGDQHFVRVQVLEELVAIAAAAPGERDLEPLYRDMIESADLAFTQTHMVSKMARVGRAMYLAQNGRKEEALPALREALALFDDQGSGALHYRLSMQGMLFQLTRSSDETEVRDEAKATLLAFLDTARQQWDADAPELGENLSAAGSYFFVHGDDDIALGILDEYSQFAKRNKDAAFLGTLANEIIQRVWDSISKESRSAQTLENALAVLRHVPDEGGRGLRADLLRTTIHGIQGRGGNHLDAIENIYALADRGDRPTKRLYDRVHELLTRIL